MENTAETAKAIARIISLFIGTWATWEFCKNNLQLATYLMALAAWVKP